MRSAGRFQRQPVFADSPPENAPLIRTRLDIYLLLPGYLERPLPKTAVVKTYPVPLVGFAPLASPGHVFAANPAKEGWQDAQLLERRREPAPRGRPRGAAARIVSGRNQPVPGRGVAQVHRCIRRGRRTSADTGAVSRGSLRRSCVRWFARAASPVGDAALSATAMGCVLARRAVGESCSWIGSGPIGCRRAARARGGIRSCKSWCPTG